MKIDKSKYQGYLWYSDEKEPRVFNNEEFELEMAENTNPFIVEGHLFNGIDSISNNISFFFHPTTMYISILKI